ncbi:MAG: TetR family transcriptional regulator [Nocardia sp.]|nr:TetR family transcriptional regulator [Nocardia sp.]
MVSESAVRPRQRAPHLGPDRRRPQVLDAALRIAVDHGIAAVTVAAVAEYLDVTRPVVYACYADRVELLNALIQREETYLLEGIGDALPTRLALADEADFIDGFRALLDTVARRPDAWKLLHGNPDPAVAGSFGRTREFALRRCALRLRPTLRAWGVADIDRKLPALVEFWVSTGESAVRTLLASDEWTPMDLGALTGGAVYRALRSA